MTSGDNSGRSDVPEVPTSGAHYTWSGCSVLPAQSNRRRQWALGCACRLRGARQHAAAGHRHGVRARATSDPSHESLLPRSRQILLRCRSSGGGRHARRGDTAYVIPPGATMTLTDIAFRPCRRVRQRGVHTVIDAFLVSLASVHGSDSIGITPSGADFRRRGWHRSHQAGGRHHARAGPGVRAGPSMPDSAVADGLRVDFVLAPEQIAERLRGNRPCLARRKAPPSAFRTTRTRRKSSCSSESNRCRLPGTIAGLRCIAASCAVVACAQVGTRSEYPSHTFASTQILDSLHEDLLIG